MPVFNWIQTRFAGGVDFVSDAPEEIAAAIEQTLLARLPVHTSCEFGACPLAGSSSVCLYLRYSTETGGAVYVHAVVSDSAPAEIPAAAVARIFELRYGIPPIERVRELVRRLAPLPVAQATLPLTDLFVGANDLQTLLPAPSLSTGSARGRRHRVGAAAVPWTITAAAIALAAFFIGQRPPTTLPSVGAAPPNLELERRLSRLEGDRGAADVSLRLQLQHERRLHERALAEKDLAIAQLEEELESAQPVAADDAPPSPERVSELVPELVPEPVPELVPELVSELAPELVPEPEVKIAVVLADLLWVREQPGSEHPTVARLAEGTRVQLDGAVQDGWSRIASPVKGWVASEFIETTDLRRSESKQSSS